MKRTGRSTVLKLSAYAALATAAITALAHAMGLCKGGGAATVLALGFEAVGLACLWHSGRRRP